MKKKVVVGLSGGVDSSVAAFLLKEQGYDVLGVTMRHFEGMENIVEDAAAVADKLGIAYDTADFRELFKREVIDYFVNEYLNGRTPNPCVMCNRSIKWEALLCYAQEKGADFIATGHYARIVRLENGRLAVAASVSAQKDQTYALYRLTQDQLARTLMPVGNYPKEEIRKIAENARLPVAHKRDSQEICFIPDHDYEAFIRRQAEPDEKALKAGKFVTADGQELGTHEGLIRYTVGQRKGLKLAMGRPVFVTRLCADHNEVVIGENEDLFTKRLLCGQLNLMAADRLEGVRSVVGKIRYGHRGTACKIRLMETGVLECLFDEPVRAATPGQSAVFYEDGHIFGGGIILDRPEDGPFAPIG